MSTATRPWPSLSPWRRWGPIAVVVALLVGVGAFASTHTTTKTATSAAGQSSKGLVARLASDPALPVTYAEAKQRGTLDAQQWGNCDPATGRVRFPSVYAPPCLPAFHGSNGGETSQGVTATTIRIAYYVAPANDLTASISGLLDPQDVVTATIKKYAEMFEHTFELYGRKVELIPVNGSGIGTDETAARADAVRVATEIKAFASLGGPAQTNAYAQELAARHVLCIGCGLSVPDSTFQKQAPYMWGSLATPEQFLLNLADLVQKNLLGKPAEYAGDPKMRTKPRVFGVVHYEQDPPVFRDVERDVAARTKGTGYVTKVQETYLLDLAKLPERAATIVAHLKSAGITTVIFMGDPIMPVYLTKAATAQEYFPEWVFTGTVLTDTTTFGRLYDPKQMAHAFGQSSLALRLPRDSGDAYRIYRWYIGENPGAYKTAATFYPSLQMLFIGLHMAGPDLTPEHFAGGMFRYPPSGGSPTSPRISWGSHGSFGNDAPPDFIGVDDSTLIWWDATAKGADEQGKDGVGMWRYVRNGERYLPGTVPSGVRFFDTAGTVTTVDQPAPADRPPTYPSPPGSPAAQKGS